MFKKKLTNAPEFMPHPSIERARKLANLLDSAFTVPVIRKKVGLDPIIGLVPGGGDIVTTLLALYPVYVAYEIGLPTHVMQRMLINVGADALIGLVPFVGDMADMFFKSNRKNLEILEKAYKQHLMDTYMQGGDPPVVDIQAVVIKTQVQ